MIFTFTLGLPSKELYLEKVSQTYIRINSDGNMKRFRWSYAANFDPTFPWPRESSKTEVVNSGTAARWCAAGLGLGLVWVKGFGV